MVKVKCESCLKGIGRFDFRGKYNVCAKCLSDLNGKSDAELAETLLSMDKIQQFRKAATESLRPVELETLKNEMALTKAEFTETIQINHIKRGRRVTSMGDNLDDEKR